jgi:TolB-like protein
MRHEPPLPAPSSLDRALALAELERVTTSRAFGGSARQVRLLRFLVGEVLEGRGSELRAPLIATRVFERPEGFDSTVDSIVRVEMSKLRRALGRHYALQGAAALRIEIERGTHAPRFLDARDAPAPESDPDGAQTAELRAGAQEPVLAVLPFVGVNTVSTPALGSPAVTERGPMASGARGRAFALGLSDRLGILFARYPAVSVVSRATSIEDAWARGARYVLEGTVRIVPAALRVAVKLHDAARGIQVWGDTYDRFDVDGRLFAVEDEIAGEIASQVLVLPMGAVHAIEAQERAGRPLETVYDVTLRLPRWLATFDHRLQDEIEDALLRILPDDSQRGLLLAFSSVFHLLCSWTAGGERERRRGADEARGAVMAEPALVSSHQALSLALLDAGDGRGALAEAEIALGIDGPLMLTGMLIALAGEWERGVGVLRTHLARLKRFPGSVRHALALDAYRRGDYALALAEAEAMGTPNLAWDPLDRAVALARLGRVPEARAAGRALSRILPDVSRDPRAVVGRMTADPGLTDDLVEGLRLSGIG